jgi:hypothetical protein
MTRLASIFSHLKCLCFENGDCFRDAPEWLIVAAFSHLSEWNSLISLSALGIYLTETTCARGIHQWVLEHLSTYGCNSFLTDYTDYNFRL